MEFAETLEPEISKPKQKIENTKKFTISLDKKEFSLTKLTINLYSDKSIEFNVNIIELRKPLFFKSKFTHEELLKTLMINIDDKINIFEYLCELVENKNVKIEQKEIYSKELNIIFTTVNKECCFKLEREDITEKQTREILFDELIEKSDSVKIKNNLNFNLKQMNLICKQMQKSICKINKNKNNDSSEESFNKFGFFIKIKYKQNGYIPLLIINNKIVEEKDILQEINIEIIFNIDNKDIKKNIKLVKNLKYYIDADLELSIIEMPRSLDNLIEYLELDDELIQKIISIKEGKKEQEIIDSIKNIYDNESIYSIYYPKEKEEIKVSYGSIDKLNKNNINHKCFTNDISPGSPIILSKNNKLIGIHLNKKNDKAELLLFTLFKFFLKYKKDLLEEKKLVNEIILEEKKDENEIISNGESSKIYTNNEMTIEYLINNKTEINIFNNKFVENNEKKCKIIYEGKSYDLFSHFKINTSENILKITLKEKEIITDMSCMFHQCFLLNSVDLSKWNTINVKNMSRMFSECGKLNNLSGIEKLNINNVTDMSSMFYSCIAFYPIFPDISNWNTENVKDISRMFSGCKALPNMAYWNLSSVENMSYLFAKNSVITSIPFISKWKNIKSVTNMSFLFSECTKLKTIPDISSWDVSSVFDMSSLFNECRELTYIKGIEYWGISNVKNMNNFFSGCEKLKSLPDISYWNMSSVTDISYFFNECKSLESLPDISGWKLDNIQNINDIFNNCINLISIPDISNWNISQVKDISSLFKSCKKLKEIPNITKWDTSNVENMSGIFFNCKNIIKLPDISNWNTQKVNNMSEMFCNCLKLETLPDISKWDFSNVKNMGKICYNCIGLTSLPKGIEKINIENVEYKEGAFDNCNNRIKIPKNFKKNDDCIIY